MERDVTEVIMTKGIFGYDLRAVVTVLPRDIHVLLTGGMLPHTGSVSIFQRGNFQGKVVLPGHKDDYVGDLWAEQISVQMQCTVMVACGIHYDHATLPMIQQIQEQAEMLLQEVLQKIRKEK